MNTDKCLNAIEVRKLIEKARESIQAKEMLKAEALRKAKKLFESLEFIEHKTVKERELQKAEELVAKANSSELNTLEVRGYAGIDPEAAKLLVKWTGHLKLIGLKTLDKEIAEILAARPRIRGKIYLDGLRELPAETARALQQSSGDISITPRQLDKLCPVAARFLVEDFRKGDDFRDLSLDSLTEIDVETAEALARFQGLLSCGLKRLDASVAEALKKYKGPYPIQAEKLECMDERSAKILAERFANPVPNDTESSADIRNATNSTKGVANQRGLKGTKRKVLVLTSLRHLNDAACRSFLEHNTGVRINPLHLETIGKIAARRIAERVSQIRLDSLKALSKEAAEALVSGPQAPQDNASLSLNGLEHLEPGVGEVLSGFAGALSLNGLADLSPAQAAVLAGHKGALDLDGLKDLAPDVAAALAKHRGKLSLNGLKRIAIDAAKCLSSHKGSISLAGLNELPDNVFDALGAYADWGNGRHDHLKSLGDGLANALSGFDGPVFLKDLGTLTLAHAAKLSKGKGALHLGLVSLPADVAVGLAASKGTQYLIFSRLQELRTDVAEALGKVWSLEFSRLGTLSMEAAKGLRGCGMLRMNGLKSLSPDTAEGLAGNDRFIWLELNGLSEVDSAVAAQLAKLKRGTLFLNGVKNLTPDSEPLLGCRCELVLNGLSKLTQENARAISHSPCPGLHLNGLKSIPQEGAEALARFKGKLTLAHVAELDEKTALALSKAAGEINLRGLKSVTHAGFFALRENGKITGLNNVREFPLSNSNKAAPPEQLTLLDTKTGRDRFYQRIFETIAAETTFRAPSDAPSIRGVTRDLKHWLEHPVTLEPRTYGMKKQEKYSGMFALQCGISGLCHKKYKGARLDEFQVLRQYLDPSIEKDKKGEKKSRLNTVYPIKSWQSLSSLVIESADNACLTTLKSNKLRLHPKKSIHDRYSNSDGENGGLELIEITGGSLWGDSDLASFHDALLKEEYDNIYRKVIMSFPDAIKVFICEQTYKADYLEEIPQLTWKDMQDKIRTAFKNRKAFEDREPIGQSDISRTISKFNKLFRDELDKLLLVP